uniref:Uncharacterized protein n=1 Tax=Parascaris univalens TaxID=6257 RepID=A0A915AJP3_PARUN
MKWTTVLPVYLQEDKFIGVQEETDSQRIAQEQRIQMNTSTAARTDTTGRCQRVVDIHYILVLYMPSASAHLLPQLVSSRVLSRYSCTFKNVSKLRYAHRKSTFPIILRKQ